MYRTAVDASLTGEGLRCNARRTVSERPVIPSGARKRGLVVRQPEINAKKWLIASPCLLLPAFLPLTVNGKLSTVNA